MGRFAIARGAAGAAILLAAACGGREPERPSVVLVTLDTTRADRIGAYGYAGARTPVFDRIAAEGALFERAWTVTPLTTPAHASLMTGLLPAAHGVRNNGRLRLSEEVETLAERFAGAGYATGGFVAAFPVSRAFGLAQGFETFDDDFGVDPGGRARSERRCDEVNARAIPWIRARTKDRDRPFFLWVHYFDAHDPYAPPGRLAVEFSGRPYDGEIAHADACLGELLGAIGEGGGLDRTVVAVTGDHGEALGEHGEPTHGLFVYEETIRIPLALRAPWTVPRGIRRTDLASLVDLLPTLLRLARLAPAEGIHGRDLFEDAAGAVPSDPTERGPARALWAESWFGHEEFLWAPLVAVRVGDGKWIAAPRPERYDLAADPGETRNLAGEEPSKDEALRSLLSRLAPWAASGAVAASEGPVDDDHLARLESLGYLGGGVGAASPPTNEAGRDPKDAVADYVLYRKGTDLLSRGGTHGAVEIFARLVENDPGNPEFRLRLGMAHWASGENDRAEGVYRELIRRHPDYYLGYRRLSSLLEKEGRWRESRDLWLSLRERGGSFVGIGSRLAAACLRTGEPARALEEADRTLAEEGETAEALVLAGTALEMLERPEEALSRHLRAVALAPSDPESLEAAARVLRALGREAEIPALYEDARRRGLASGGGGP